MAATEVREIIGVFHDEAAARAAADAASRLTSGSTPPRIGSELDEVASLKAEMREEMQHTTAGAGNVGPFTKEMTKGVTAGTIIGIVVGIVVCTPLGFIAWAPIGLVPRLVIAAVVGAFAGATIGFVAGGGFGAKGPDQKLAAERGTTVRIDVRTSEEVEQVTEALRRHDPIRIDLTTADGNPISTITTEEEEMKGKP